MNVRRTISLALLLAALGPVVEASQKKDKSPKITEKTFRQTSSLLLDDPLAKSNRDWSRIIMLYALDTTDAAVVLGKEELRWAGVENNDPRSLLLLAAYAAGNVQAQLNSGVKRNDRYSGLLTMFRVYRALKKQNENFKVDAVDDLLALHEGDKLVQHVQKLDEKKPEKRTPVEEAVIRRLMTTR